MNKHLTEKERYVLETLLKEKNTVAQIAKKMNRCRATIYNEIKRGKTKQLTWELEQVEVYLADVGQRIHEENQMNKGRPLKVSNDLQYIKYIEQKVKEHYSFYALLHLPEANSFKTKLCERTLYNYYYHDVFLNLMPEDMPYKVKQKKDDFDKRSVAFHNLHARSIEERPKDILKREVFGHWEMDTVVGGKGKSKNVLLVLTERKTRQEIVKKIKDKRASSVVRAIDNLENEYGKKNFRKIFKTITMDNGVEFLDFKGIEKGGRTTTYYCHPFCSSERGSNENQNKLIRRFVPKGEDIKNYTHKQVQEIENFINNYPRRMFGGMSSNEYILHQLE